MLPHRRAGGIQPRLTVAWGGSFAVVEDENPSQTRAGAEAADREGRTPPWILKIDGVTPS